MFDRLFRKPPPPAIADDDWLVVLDRYPFLQRLPGDELTRLRTLCAEFLARKAITGAADLEPTERMKVAIAAQACLPILHLGLAWYQDLSEIVLYPGAFAVPRSIVDDAGVVHEFTDALTGEAMHGGPVVLSWEDVAGEYADIPGDDTDARDAAGHGLGAPRDDFPRDDDALAPQYNVVIHEFVHKLDMASGEADGCPPLPAAVERIWRHTLAEALDAFRRQIDRIEDRIPAHIDPEGPDADPWWAELPIDPYAATDEAEFFAVCGEHYFIEPESLQQAFPSLFNCLDAFFRGRPTDVLQHSSQG